MCLFQKVEAASNAAAAAAFGNEYPEYSRAARRSAAKATVDHALTEDSAHSEGRIRFLYRKKFDFFFCNVDYVLITKF